MKFHYKICLSLFFLMNIVFAQSDLDKAKAYYFQAETQFESGNAEKTIEYLEQAEALMGVTNGSIEALKVKSYFKIKEIEKAHRALTNFYGYVDGAPPELQKEMSGYLVKIEDELALKDKVPDIINEYLKKISGNESLKLINELTFTGSLPNAKYKLLTGPNNSKTFRGNYKVSGNIRRFSGSNLKLSQNEVEDCSTYQLLFFDFEDDDIKINLFYNNDLCDEQNIKNSWEAKEDNPHNFSELFHFENFPNNYSKFEYLGEEIVGNDNCHKVKLSNPKQVEVTALFDKNSKLLKKIIFSKSNFMTYDDYKSYAGFLIPYKIGYSYVEGEIQVSEYNFR